MFEGFGASGVVLVRLGRAGNASWVRLRASGLRRRAVVEVSWNHLGVSWEDPEGVLAFGSFLEGFWEYFGKFLCHLEQYAKIAKKLEKPLVFH